MISLLGGLKSGEEALTIHFEISESQTYEALLNARLHELSEGHSQSTLFKKIGDRQYLPVDFDNHARSLADMIDQSVSRVTSAQDEPLAMQLRNVSARLKNHEHAEQALKELDIFLEITNRKGGELELITDLRFRKANLQDRWNQLGSVPGTDFAQEGKDLVLRKARSTTGERLSSSTQLLAFYDEALACSTPTNPTCSRAA